MNLNYLSALLERAKELNPNSSDVPKAGAYFKSGVSTGGFIRIEDGYQPAKYLKPKKRNLVFEKMELISKSIPGQMFYASEN